jgi:hypothetical protein
MSVSVTSSEVLSPQTTLVPENADFDVPSSVPVRGPNLLKQPAMSLTLDGPTVLTSAIGLIILIHFSAAYVAEALVALVPLVLFIKNDYQNYLNLGPGGTPATFRGYLRISYLRLWTLRDPFVPPPASANDVPSKGILAQQRLPYRIGPKPQVAGIAPHRQIDQQGSPYCFQALRRTLQKLALKSPNKFGTARSCVEKHGLALFAKHAVQTNCQGEVCHIHDSDFSMHMCLHPEDSKELLHKGWGQRHPLAWRWGLIRTPVSQDFVMVYAPRGTSREIRANPSTLGCKLTYTQMNMSFAQLPRSSRRRFGTLPRRSLRLTCI